jgi:hypothetical protein
VRALGYEVENPADHGIVPGAEWADYMAYDLTRPGLCGMIALLTDATIMRKNVNGRPAPTQPAALASSQIRTSTGSSGHKLSSGKASAMFCSARRWRHDRSAALHALAHLQGAIGSGNFQCIDTYPPIGHELKILAPFMEGLLLPATERYQSAPLGWTSSAQSQDQVHLRAHAHSAIRGLAVA